MRHRISIGGSVRPLGGPVVRPSVGLYDYVSPLRLSENRVDASSEPIKLVCFLFFLGGVKISWKNFATFSPLRFALKLFSL